MIGSNVVEVEIPKIKYILSLKKLIYAKNDELQVKLMQLRFDKIILDDAKSI
jgi:hypothetical protein